MTEKEKSLQPRNESGQYDRTSGIRSLEEGILTTNEKVRIGELRRLLWNLAKWIGSR